MKHGDGKQETENRRRIIVCLCLCVSVSVCVSHSHKAFEVSQRRFEDSRRLEKIREGWRRLEKEGSRRFQKVGEWSRLDHRLHESSSRAHKVSPEHGNHSAKAALGHINLPLTDGCSSRAHKGSAAFLFRLTRCLQ